MCRRVFRVFKHPEPHSSGAHSVMLTLEDMSLEEIETFRTHYEKLAVTAREKLRQGQADTSIPAITIG